MPTIRVGSAGRICQRSREGGRVWGPERHDNNVPRGERLAATRHVHRCSNTLSPQPIQTADACLNV
eukprot:scaffold374553_cov32-Prasinocladus_malaysianus.AAC.1